MNAQSPIQNRDADVIRVLLVEDSQPDAWLVRADLEGASGRRFQVTVAARASEAIDLLTKESFDVVVLDLGLPDSQGIETFFTVNAGAGGVPIIVMSGLADEVAAVTAVQAGAQDYLVKGHVDSLDIQRAVRYAVERHALRRDLATRTDEVSASRESFHNIVARATDGIIVVDGNGTVCFVNPTAEVFLGRKAHEICGEPLGYQIEIDGAAEVEIRLGDGTIGTGEVRTADTEWEGEHARLVLVRDATDRKRVEHALRKSEERYRSLVRSIADVVYEIDAAGRFLFVSRSVAALGYEPEELIGRHFATIIHPNDVARVSRRELLPQYAGRTTGDQRAPKLFDERRSGPRGTTSLEVRLVPKPGHDREDKGTETTGSITVIGDVIASGHYHEHLEQEGRQFLGTVGVIRDITERKAMETELAEHRDRLQTLVEERTAELEVAQRELVEKERLAAVGQLVSAVNHEIRNPLTTLRTALFLLENRLEDEGLGVESTLDRAKKSVSRCEKIVEELVDYAKAVELELQATAIDPWLASVLDEHPVPPGIVVKRDLRSGLEILVDQDRLRQCVADVINNACEAMGMDTADDRRGELTIATCTHGDQLHIVVRDTGPGISDEIRDRVLEPMFTTKSFGLGLGLAIVQRIMRQHGGGIDVAREAGTGTTVTLWLPLRESRIAD